METKIGSWRAHSCVPRRHSCRRLSPELLKRPARQTKHLWSRRFRLPSLACTIAALLLALIAFSCKGKHDRVTVQNEEPDTGRTIESTVRMNDPKTSAQLLSGFYPVENNSWRWTAGKFSVLLPIPPTAAQRGATATLAFTVPDGIIQKVKNVTIIASVNGMTLTSIKYDTAGSYVFNADIPASMLTAESVRVDFALDKSLPPDGADRRELGVIATSVGIGAK